MESESLRGIRTMAHVRCSGDIWRQRRARSLSSLSGIEEKAEAQVHEARLQRLIAGERKRFAMQEMAIMRSRNRLLAVRRKLKTAKAYNLHLMQCRQQLMQERRKRQHSDPPGHRPNSGASQRLIMEY